MLKKCFLVLGVMLAVATSSFAITTANGTFSFNSTGGIISDNPAGSILTASSITIPVPNATINCGTGTNVCEQITNIPGTYLGFQNDFALGGNTPESVNNDVTFNNYTFTLIPSLSLPVFHFSTEDTPPGRFTFTATSGTRVNTSVPGSDFVNIGYLGTFHDATGFYVDSPALLAITFSQSGGSTGAISFSGTFATPPSGVPEPTTMALLGSALVGIGLIGRKRFAR